MPDFELLPFPELHSSSFMVNRAYRIAMGDLVGNVRPFKDGLLESPQPVILAGLDYDTPWTRDASINVWNGLGLIWPNVARNTLLSVLQNKEGQVSIGGQYWDSIIWAVGAWAYYLYTADRDFLSLAFEAVKNSLEQDEVNEYDEHFGLFRGPAVYGDGVAAYPERYSPGNTSSILDWVKANPDKKAPRGYGIPMVTLSTNCVYAEAYRAASWMAKELGQENHSVYEQRGAVLIEHIQSHLWNSENGTFNYLLDPLGSCDYQEGLGHSFALLFNLATRDQADSILSRQEVTPVGIPCVWPSFSRYTGQGGFGRHSGTVWPFISGFWGEAALRRGRADLFEREFLGLTKSINQHAQCAEIYHPATGEIYGGLQENGGGPDGMQWISCARQSWSASAYLRMILTGLFGMRFTPKGISFQPYLPVELGQIKISGLPYRGCQLDLSIEGHGGQITQCQCNGSPAQPFLPADLIGRQSILIRVAE